MSPPRLKWARRYGWPMTLLLFYLASLGFFSLLGDRGLFKSYSLWKECQRLDQVNAGLAQEIATLRQEVVAYRGDLRAIERQAREQLHLAGDNEIHYIFR